MTSRRKSLLALALVGLAFLGVPLVGQEIGIPFSYVIAFAVCVGLIYMFWVLLFSCPKCGTPLLWEMRGHMRIVRLIPPRECPKCGQSTCDTYLPPSSPPQH